MGVTGRFLFAFLGCTVICTILWERFVFRSIYQCTDPVLPEYLRLPPLGEWSHSSEPGDWIKPGWSNSQVSALWYSMAAGSILISALSASATGKQKQ